MFVPTSCVDIVVSITSTSLLVKIGERLAPYLSVKLNVGAIVGSSSP